MSRNYRGPYFRTGVDGVGNFWELSDGPSRPIHAKKRIVARKPTTWELQKPKSPAPPPAISTETSGYGNVSSPDRLTSTGVEFPAEQFITKEKLKEMMKEILNESMPILPPTPEPPKSAKEEKLQSEEVPPPEVAKRVKKVSSKSSNGGTPPLPKVDLQNMDLPKVNPIPTPIVSGSHREQKMRTFECFRKMSCDPPKTPPPSISAKFETKPTEASMSVSSGEKKVTIKRSRSKKSKAPIPYPQITSDPLLQGYGFYPGYTQFQTLTLPQSKAFGPRAPVPKMPNLGRGRETKEESLNSTMIVKKVPLINGFFNDSLLPPILSPEPKRKVIKKQFDAYAWRHMEDWSQEHKNHMMVYAQQFQEANQAHRLVNLKPQVKATTKATKPIHPSKQFPVHVPGPKKENLYIGPYIDSELALVRKDQPKFQTK